ncbi:hypothetical protein [Leisingera sp. JC1]|uniref:hypothetical protein n=1 Tax=Leisingera sp. JC1 TaxID=1855282 RepID=UPI000803B005|nr:hypothetical protein [Leisingera sp. JC1]OBY25193.1 hypothetical protein A9D60_22760 [Leisingera sp. JC1]
MTYFKRMPLEGDVLAQFKGSKRLKRRPEIILMLLFALVLLLLIAAIFQALRDTKEHSEFEAQMSYSPIVGQDLA